MPDIREVIEQLIAKRAELQAEIGGIDQSIRTLTSLLNSLKDSGVEVKLPSTAGKPEAQGVQRERGILPPSEIAHLARGVLLKKGQPLKRGALVRQMESEGIPLPGKDKAKNLGTILWRHLEDFVSLDKLGYWPRDKAIAGVYDPMNPPDKIISPRLSDHA